MNKKIGLFLVILLILTLFTLPISSKKAWAEPSANPIFATIDKVQEMIENALEPIMLEIESLKNRVTAIDLLSIDLKSNLTNVNEKLNNHEERISNLENGSAKLDYYVPPQNLWQYFVSPRAPYLDIWTSYGNDTPEKTCSWSGKVLGSSVQARAIAHFPTKDYYTVGNCSHILFQPINNIPPSGATIPVDIYFMWWGVEKHVEFNLTILP